MCELRFRPELCFSDELRVFWNERGTEIQIVFLCSHQAARISVHCQRTLYLNDNE